MVDRDAICVLIPTYNEAEAIGEVIERFQAAGYENLFVMDGGSTDGTRDIAADLGAAVHIQSGDGKGQAVREAVDIIDAEYILLIDGDATYRPEQADRLVEPLLAGEAEHVIGDRFADMQSGAMSKLNQVGNRVINTSFGFIHGRHLDDILSGYRAFTRDSFQRLSLSSDGFGIETELSVECLRHDIRTMVVPITYETRPEGSETNLRPFRDGGNILITLYRLAKKNNPIFYFGSVGVASGLVGLFLAVFVAFNWILYGISREVIALASGVALLFGLQMVMFGVLSDLIVNANRQQRKQFDRIEGRIDRLEESLTTERETRAGEEELTEHEGRSSEAGPTQTVDDASATKTDGLSKREQ